MALIDNPKLEFKLTEKMDLNMSESYIWVQTELQLKELVEVLSKERVFGVDTEQHSLRSFLGFTALVQVSYDNILVEIMVFVMQISLLVGIMAFVMQITFLFIHLLLKFDQISTEKEDYLIDTIALHDLMGNLRAVFADPSICKVFKKLS